MSLFNHGAYTLHSGAQSNFKIDCDALTDEDANALVSELARILQDFGIVFDCGGASVRLASLLRRFSKPNCLRAVLIDDVLTTGNTMELRRQELVEAGRWDILEDTGAVIFARGLCPVWVTPLFRMQWQS